MDHWTPRDAVEESPFLCNFRALSEARDMNCPRCGSVNIRRSQSQDSIWFRFVLQKKMRCQRCCFAFVSPVWENPVRSPIGIADVAAPTVDEAEMTKVISA